MLPDRSIPPDDFAAWWRRRRGQLLLAPAVLVGWVALLAMTSWLREPLTPPLIALLLAYVFNPAVTAMERLRIPRVVSITALYLVLLGPLLGLVYFAGPTVLRELVDESNDLAAATQTFRDNLREFLERYPDLARFVFGDGRGPGGGLGGESGPVLGSNPDAGGGSPLAGGPVRWIADWPAMAQTVLGFLLSRGWLGVLTTGTLLTGFYLFFFLWRFNEMPAAVQAHIPRAMRAPALRMAARLDAMMGDFFRGRVPIMIAVGLLTAGALRACSVQYGVLIGVATGIAGLVPVLPLAVGFVPTVVSAYVSSAGSWEWVAAAAGVFLGIQLLDARVLTPLIQGRRSGLHPVSVVLSVLIGYHTAETFGVLVALPTACLVKVVFTEFILPPLRELAAE